jgi:hypothetical protein
VFALRTALAAIAGATLAACVSVADAPLAGTRFERMRAFDAPAARQGVAIDADHFYAIGNRRIEKYTRNGQRVSTWEEEETGPIVHLNSGIVLDGALYCAHSNYPEIPMVSSIEVFDADTLSHRGSHAFGIFAGSATWVDRHDGHWWVAFANYEGRGGVPGKGPDWTTLVQFDSDWRRVGAYVFPPELVDRFAGRSNSGGAFGADGRIYATGHDAPEVYVLRLPRAGATLELVDILPAPIAGQGIAWDPMEENVLWGIVKSARQVVVTRLAPPQS